MGAFAFARQYRSGWFWLRVVSYVCLAAALLWTFRSRQLQYVRFTEIALLSAPVAEKDVSIDTDHDITNVNNPNYHTPSNTRHSIRHDANRPDAVRLMQILQRLGKMGTLSHPLSELPRVRTQPMMNAGLAVDLVPPENQLKIFVYELPSKFTDLILIRNNMCESTVFSTEIWLHQMMLQSSYRTIDPSRADLFYIPVYATCIVYRDFGKFQQYRRLVKDAIDYVRIQYPYWNASDGLDHVITLVHDYGACLSWVDNSEAVFFDELRKTIVISHLGDLTMGCHSVYKDVVIPPMSHNEAVFMQGLGGYGQNHTALPKVTFAYFRGTVNWYHYNAIPELRIKQGYSTTYSKGVRGPHKWM